MLWRQICVAPNFIFHFHPSSRTCCSELRSLTSGDCCWASVSVRGSVSVCVTEEEEEVDVSALRAVQGAQQE